LVFFTYYWEEITLLVKFCFGPNLTLSGEFIHIFSGRAFCHYFMDKIQAQIDKVGLKVQLIEELLEKVFKE
jgi:hypothetical protein